MSKLLNLKSYGVYSSQPYVNELEYIESTGTQWIDTGFILSNTSSAMLQAKIMRNPSSLIGLFGSRSSASSKNMSASINKDAPNYRIDADFNNSDYSVYRANTVSSSIIGDVDIFVSATQRSITLNGHTETNSIVNSDVFTTPNACRLFSALGISNGTPSAFQCLSFKIWDNGILVRDYIPVNFINESGQLEVAVYDKRGVGGMNPDGSARNDGIYRNRGTGNFIGGPVIRNISLPYDSEVDYVESTWTQYIDTLVNVDSNLSVEITMANAGTPWSNVNPVGAILPSPRCRHHLNFTFQGVRYFLGVGDSCFSLSNIKPSDGDVFTFKVDAVNKTFTLGSFLGTLPNDTFDTGLSYWLFGRNGTTPPYLCSLRIYSAKLWNGNTLVRDFIPVRVGQIGALYDKANPTGGPNGNGLYFSESAPLIPGSDKS